MGQIVIQLAALGGLEVYTTASSKHHDFLKGLGAKTAFDYHDPDVGKKIREATGGKLAHAVDCISEKDTPDQIARAIGDAGGEVSIILHYESRRPDVQVKFVLTYFLVGKASIFLFDCHCPALNCQISRILKFH